ncbi:thioesterase domain-containing protein [Enterocloster clostridioformis]
MKQNLILLRKGVLQEKHIFFIHDGIGEVYKYFELCRYIGEEYNCWGITGDLHGRVGPFKLTVSEAMVPIVDAIKSVIVNSIVLVGWSIGGLLATEVCKILEKDMIKVNLLVLIDSYPLEIPGDYNEFTIEEELSVIAPLFENEAYWKKIRVANDTESLYKSIIKFGKLSIIQSIKENEKYELVKLLPTYYMDNIAELITAINTLRTYINTCSQLKIPEKLNAKILFFQAEKSRNNEIAAEWGELSQLFFVSPVEGNHSSALDTSNAEQIGDKIMEKMNEGK